MHDNKHWCLKNSTETRALQFAVKTILKDLSTLALVGVTGKSGH